MGWFQGAGWKGTKWVLVGLGLLSTSCVGVAGAGAAVAIVGAGALAFTCYDRVSVTVTDRVTATKLCDAKVSFWKGDSETVATSCYQAALSAGKYKLRVERRGLITFEEPVEVTEGGDCGGTVQTMYVALDRKSRGAAPPTAIQAPAPPPPAVAAPPAAPPAAPVAPPAAPPPAAPPPAATTPPAGVAPGAPLPPPPPPPPPPAAAPPPASTAFPDAPR
ncbi:MAG TPA: hypothetical protein VHP33_25420 [Polyangiaceae bacterium]|nr:hypothetical protein [Polyangiaceae bacterium]